MWRTYVICVLIGLLLSRRAAMSCLTRQVLAARRRRPSVCAARMVRAESAQNSLQQQLDQLKLAARGAPRARAPPPPQLPRSRHRRRRRTPAADRGRRGRPARPAAEALPCRSSFSIRPRLQRYFVDRFNNDYLPSERESDQKLLTTLGLIGPNDSVVQILLDILQEQIIGVYNQDDKSMYLRDRQRPVRARRKRHLCARILPTRCRTSTSICHARAEASDNDDRVAGDAGADRRRRGPDAAALGAAEADARTRSISSVRAARTRSCSRAPLFLREQLLFPYTRRLQLRAPDLPGAGWLRGRRRRLPQSARVDRADPASSRSTAPTMSRSR